MTPKEEAEQLLKEFGSRGTPFNDAGILVNEMIYEIEKYGSYDENKGIEYWEKVREELDKMCTDENINNENEILYGKKKFHLRIYDNNHYMDESEAYNHGQYDTYEEAMKEAKKIVDEFFEDNWRQGVTADYLIGQYCLYGDDPIILPNEHGKHKSFSARTYAQISAVKICLKFQNE